MTAVRTITLSLSEEDVLRLDLLARNCGSQSEAIHRLLSDHAKAQEERQMEEIYKEYYSNPANVAAGRNLTREMMAVSS